MTAADLKTATLLRVTGLVQGVGFRPFVWRLAHELGFAGTVRNTAAGVEILLAEGPEAVARFKARLVAERPPLARIDAIALETVAAGPFDGFAIVASGGGAVATGIVPDAAVCAACAAEIRDPAERRHGYAFANCTHCGPRLTIVEAIPYDRRTTAMKAFPMCPACRAEYENPADRRFHAQPIACADCGPRLFLEDSGGRCADGDEIAAVARRLRAGGIVAIKGIGGFHLACRADDEAAVGELRRRKRRLAKPFALMAADLDAARRHCLVEDGEADLMTGPAAPIVLLVPRRDAAIAPSVAPGQGRVGVMLPYAPLHLLVFDALGLDLLVMTSANESGEPPVIDNDEARRLLLPLADAVLFHDRAIVNRVDDGVVRLDRTGPTLIRRARGLAPAPIGLPPGFEGAPPVLAMGGDLKGAFAFAAGGQVTLSQHLGDLDEPHTLAEFGRAIALYRRILRQEPHVIAVDRHPAYRSSALGRRLAEADGARIVAVQHHHAHLAAALADHGVPADAGPSLGIVLDGLGWGEDGTVWGGEFLVGDYRRFERRAWFSPVALPGGDAAAREPWRNTFAHLLAAFGSVDGLPGLFAGRSAATLARMIERGVNSPLSSSAGRLFDAVAAALGLCPERQAYEGQAAMELEALAEPAFADATAWPVPPVARGAIEWSALWQRLVEDRDAGVAAATIAARFHRTLAAVVAGTARAIAADSGLTRVALTGGVFQNRLLLEAVAAELDEARLTPIVHRRVPSNDGGLALGQAAIAALA